MTGPAPAEGKEVLLEAYDRLIEHEATKPLRAVRPTEAAWRRFVRPAIIATSAAAVLYFAAARPAWLYPRYDAPTTTPPARVARRTLTTVAVLVRAYQDDTGALPASLEEVGVDLP